MFLTRHRDNLRRAARLAMPACLVLALTSPLLAQPDSWTLRISESELQLAFGDDPMWMKVNMWDLGLQRMGARNLPTIELTNTDTTGLDIVQFQMSIGDLRFHFGDDSLGTAALLGKTTPGYDLTPTVSPDGNLLTVLIGNDGGPGGLGPGETLRFRIDIDLDEKYKGQFFSRADFRTVLFDMNGINVYDGNVQNFNSADNSHVSVLFSDGSKSGPFPFRDEVVDAPQSQYYNSNFRPRGVMEPVDVFEPVIPEPASGLLALSAILAGAGFRKPRRAAGSA